VQALEQMAEKQGVKPSGKQLAHHPKVTRNKHSFWRVYLRTRQGILEPQALLLKTSPAMNNHHLLSRRDFLTRAALSGVAAALWHRDASAASSGGKFSPQIPVFSKLYQEL